MKNGGLAAMMHDLLNMDLGAGMRVMMSRMSGVSAHWTERTD